jgi:hypothetical protein
MWVVWALIILGGVLDAADSVMLRNAKDNLCISVEHIDKGQLTHYRRCEEGSARQTWQWEGKRLKNKLAGECLRVMGDYSYDLFMCDLLAKKKESNIESMEFTRFGAHGLKNSKEKCLKFSRGGLRLASNCTEDKEDPYYE